MPQFQNKTIFNKTKFLAFGRWCSFDIVTFSFNLAWKQILWVRTFTAYMLLRTGKRVLKNPASAEGSI